MPTPAVIEIRKVRESLLDEHGEFDEYELFVDGSPVQHARIGRDPIHPIWFDVHFESEIGVDALLSFALSQFVDGRVIDIDIPYTVDWNGAIGQVSIDYDPDENVSSLSIKFSRVARWHGWPFSFDEYFRTLQIVTETLGIRELEFDSTESYGPLAKFPIESSVPIKEELDRCLVILAVHHDEIIRRLTTHSNSLEISFDFPEEVRIPCEQYLLYFVQFLKDLGVQATADLRHEAGKLLFAVTPGNQETALDNIRTALQTYLELPLSPVDTDAIGEYEIAAQRLSANVDHLKGQVRLVNAELRLANATIQQQQITIHHLLASDVVLRSLSAADTKPASDEPERLFGGTVALTTFDKYGVRVSLAEVFRKLRRLFSEEEGKD